MEITPPTAKPPCTCIFCGQISAFSSKEHIVPHSLGNDLLVLAPGWVCDRCNNICSGFEAKALNSSILGVERCRLGVVTKKRRPARSDVHGISWFSEPRRADNVAAPPSVGKSRVMSLFVTSHWIFLAVAITPSLSRTWRYNRMLWMTSR